MMGRVVASNPILAEEHIGDYRLPISFTPREGYPPRVRGMSMRDAGRFKGDLPAFHRTPIG